MDNSVEEAVIATDLTGKVLFWNLMAERIYGWKWHEAVGRSISELVVPDSAQQDAGKILQRLQQGKSWTGKFKLRRRNGTEFIGTVTDQPMQDSQGNLVGIIGISHPETELSPSKS
jgi:PAS domain S-box-containing protein